MVKKDSDIKFDFFDIDLNRLDEEWVNQPRMYFKYSTLLTDAKEELERCKAQMEVANDVLKEVKAKLSFRIRTNPEKYLGSDVSPTEAAIANRTLQHSLYAKAKAAVYHANEQIILANKKVSTFYTAVNTLDHRKSALERLVSLHGQNYFSTPKPVDKHSIDAVNHIEKGASRLASKKRKRKAT